MRDEKLRRMKWLATGLLVLAAAAYGVSHRLDLHYVAAFSEAAMIMKTEAILEAAVSERQRTG